MKKSRRSHFSSSGGASQRTDAFEGSRLPDRQDTDTKATFERKYKNPTPKVRRNKIPPLTSRGAGWCGVSVVLIPVSEKTHV